MIHEPRDIKDRVAVGDDIFIMEQLDGGRVRLIPDPTHVLEVGTPINKALLQPIEDTLGEVTRKLSKIEGEGGLIPRGLIAMWSGSVDNIPSGWALCDGSNGTPDLRDRFIVGAGGNYNVGDTGGANTVTLNTNQIPSHSHGAGTLTTNTTGSHSHTYQRALHHTQIRTEGGQTWVSGGIEGSQTNPNGDHKHTISGSTSSTGGGQAHENRPPYYALAYIMKL